MRKNAPQAQVIAELHSQYNKLEEMLAQLKPAQKNLPGIVGDLSVKGLLAHLTAWDARGILWIGDALLGEMPKIPAPNETWSARHTFNAEIQRASGRRSFARVLDEYRSTFNQLVELVEGIDERDWDRRVTVQHKTGTGETLAISQLVRWRVQHLATHTKPLSDWLKEQSAPNVAEKIKTF